MADYNVDQMGEDSVRDEEGGDSAADYKYTLGIHGVNTNVDGDQVPQGGDNRWHLQGAFPNIVTRVTASPWPEDVHFEAKSINELMEFSQPLPNEVSETFDPTLDIGFGVGPVFNAGFASIQIGEVYEFDSTYEGEINHYYWNMPQSSFPTPQEDTAGVSFDLNADADAAEGKYVSVGVHSSYGYGYDIWLSGGTAYVETPECYYIPEFEVV
ncbi:MAG: hypothetical protein V5A34_11325 [Halapricum sp.]